MVQTYKKKNLKREKKMNVCSIFRELSIFQVLFVMNVSFSVYGTNTVVAITMNITFFVKALASK